MAAARCPDCHRFCSLEVPSEFEDYDLNLSDDRDAEGEGFLTLDYYVRMVRESSCCLVEVKEYTFSDVLKITIGNHAGEWHGISTKVGNVWDLGLFRESDCGFEIEVALECSCGDPVWVRSISDESHISLANTITLTGKVAVSDMEDV